MEKVDKKLGFFFFGGGRVGRREEGEREGFIDNIV